MTNKSFQQVAMDFEQMQKDLFRNQSGDSIKVNSNAKNVLQLQNKS